MKIIIQLSVPISAGGAFHQGINAILQMRGICEGKYQLHVVTTKQENLTYLEKLNIAATLQKLTWLDKLIIILSFSGIFIFLQNKFKLISSFEKHIIKLKGDFVYFLTQSNHPCLLVKTQFITTIFDICHQDHPEFPEVREYREFSIREVYFKNMMPAASLIIAESEQLAIALTQKYGVDNNRILVMPMVPSFDYETEDQLSVEDVMQLYKLKTGYFFYPSQYWPHKNHIRIIQAIKLLKKKGHEITVLFVGSDKGNQSYLKKIVKELNISEQVVFLNFVPQEHLIGFYRGSRAVVMPTYFGPTNIPPLEAWSLKKPLIYSQEMAAQSKDAAIHVDPDNAAELADALMACFDEEMNNDLIQKGEKRLKEIRQERSDAEQKLSIFLESMKKRRECWESY